MVWNTGNQIIYSDSKSNNISDPFYIFLNNQIKGAHLMIGKLSQVHSC